ncbi:MAG TPA: CHAP domain-containing protein [Acidimicrobiales bacterium]|nr:CHAP domain-containing protein [Acidimicrobiales bacterium]
MAAGALVTLAASIGVGPLAHAGATSISGTSPKWCSDHGASVVAWTGTTPNLPICGPGPGNGGTYSYVTIPGPYGAFGYYYNATSGFQCVELAERFLAVVDGLAPVLANGQQVAANYHAAYVNTSLYVNGTPGAVGHAPKKGDVISFSNAPGFDAVAAGHVAIVDKSKIDARGNGTVTIAQENVGAGYWIYTLDVDHWRLVDPMWAPDALWGFGYAEWLDVKPYRSVERSSAVRLFSRPVASAEAGPIAGLVALSSSGGKDRFTGRHSSEGFSPSRIASSSFAWNPISAFSALFPPRSSAASRARVAASRASTHAGS